MINYSMHSYHQKLLFYPGLLLLLSVFAVNQTSAQHTKAYPVKAGEIPNRVLPNEAMYVLPAFATGSALQRDGTAATFAFNYNFLQDEMHFIGIAGDTLAIAEPVLLKTVVIGTLIFYYDKGYLQQIFTAGKYSLAMRQQMVQIADKTTGAYDAASGASAIKTYGTINNNSQIYQLEVKKDVVFEKVVGYYIGAGSNPFVKASRRNFELFFADKAVSAYCKTHRVNFNNEADLKALLLFCVE